MNIRRTLLALFSCVATTVAAPPTVIIGDSMFWSGMLFFGGQPSPLARWLETWAGHPIENHALVGASLENGWVKSIRQQYDDLKTTPGVLVMDGGGNDVMSHRADCEAWNDACVEVIDRCIDIARGILNDSSHAGVGSVLYLGFYYLPNLNQAADYANPRLKDLCENEFPRYCYYTDPRYNETTGEGLKTPEMLGSDGLHPNPDGYKVLATMVWETATHHNITL